MNMRGYFFWTKKKYILEKIIQACPMNLLGNRNHVFFYVGENKYPRMFIVHVWNIFSDVLFFLKRKKNHACLKTYMDFFFIGESPHKSYEHTWFFSNSQFGLPPLSHKTASWGQKQNTVLFSLNTSPWLRAFLKKLFWQNFKIRLIFLFS